MNTTMPDPQRLKEILERISVKGASGGGEVQIVLPGTGLIKKINIDDTLLRPSNKALLESMIIAAYADANARLQEELVRTLGQLTLGE
jgi:hypothetical protein